MKKKNFALRILKSLHRKYRIATNSDKVWHSVYEETVEENIEHWNCLKELISAYCPSAKITVLIMPFNPIFRLFHRRQIKFMRQRFLSALGKGNFQICDHFALFKRDRYFDDHCHLNERGAHRYTTFLKKILGS